MRTDIGNVKQNWKSKLEAIGLQKRMMFSENEEEIWNQHAHRNGYVAKG